MAAVYVHVLNSGVRLALFLNQVKQCESAFMAQPQNSLKNPYILSKVTE